MVNWRGLLRLLILFHFAVPVAIWVEQHRWEKRSEEKAEVSTKPKSTIWLFGGWASPKVQISPLGAS